MSRQHDRSSFIILTVLTTRLLGLFLNDIMNIKKKVIHTSLP